MNLRQKAKYYKQRCEMLEKLTLPHRPPFRYADTEQPIVTLCSEQHIPIEAFAAMQVTDDMKLNMIKRRIARDLLHKLLNYTQVVAQRDESLNCVVIKVTMKVVDISKE